MPFTPSNANLGTHLELENFFYSINYTNSFGTSFPVTITTNMPNTSVTVTSNTIYNYYSEVFTSNTIVYLSKDRTDISTSSWLVIDNIVNRIDTFSSILEIYDWSPDPTVSKTYYYTASAGGETKLYNIVVLNNWDTGKANLLYYLDLTRRVFIPRPTQVRWINIDAQQVIWLNDNIENSSITWISGS
jgi:hypothetical protein